MIFGEAIAALKAGKKVCRTGWNGKGMWLFLVADWDFQVGENNSIENLELLPFICMKTADDKLVPWLASQTDVLAEDWMVVE
jgi:hypothetical protein